MGGDLGDRAFGGAGAERLDQGGELLIVERLDERAGHMRSQLAACLKSTAGAGHEIL